MHHEAQVCHHGLLHSSGKLAFVRGEFFPGLTLSGQVMRCRFGIRLWIELEGLLYVVLVEVLLENYSVWFGRACLPS